MDWEFVRSRSIHTVGVEQVHGAYSVALSNSLFEAGTWRLVLSAFQPQNPEGTRRGPRTVLPSDRLLWG